MGSRKVRSALIGNHPESVQQKLKVLIELAAQTDLNVFFKYVDLGFSSRLLIRCLLRFGKQ